MPFQAVAWAWNVPDLAPIERCALLWLANKADDLGVAYRVDRRILAAFCGCESDELDGALRMLEVRQLTMSTDLDDAIWLAAPLTMEWLTDGVANGLPVPSRLKAEVIAAAEGRCFACGSTDEPHVDHIIPRSKGGSNRRENLQVLCRACNTRKSDKLGWVRS